MDKIIEHLKGKNKILFLTTSTRWAGEANELPKSTQLALKLAKAVGEDKVQVLDVAKLKIYPCEGNVSAAKGNDCGPLKVLLKDKEKNPSGCHRCYASLNNPDDELWQVSKPLLAADCVVFFGSVRWGQMNSIYQKLIERLTWLENRHSTLGEDNVLAEIEAGLLLTGHNWNGATVLATQKQVLNFFGFKVVDDLFWHWQYTDKAEDESMESYVKANEQFTKEFLS